MTLNQLECSQDSSPVNLGIIYANIARCYLSLNKLDEAKTAIDRSLEYSPENPINRTHLVDYYIR
ncbi:MAG: tetratricopeptide repeat protein, partial [Candidatus Omnitrophota bacterium]